MATLPDQHELLQAEASAIEATIGENTPVPARPKKLGNTNYELEVQKIPPVGGEYDPSLSYRHDYIEKFEQLNKWKGCLLSGAPERYVYQHNRTRAMASGFPSRMEVGLSQGLTEHEVAAVFGWTTGDYRLVNPIARGQEQVEFQEYPFLPNKLTKATCRLSRRDVLPYVQVLCSALSKLPSLDSKQRLWRGHRRKISQTVGSTIVLKGFTSVTRDRDDALAFATKDNEGRSSQRTLLAFEGHFSGRCIAKLSARKEETEVLFPLDTTFEVVAAPKDSYNDKVVVETAQERLRGKMPNAEINLVYLKEVKLDG